MKTIVSVSLSIAILVAASVLVMSPQTGVFLVS